MNAKQIPNIFIVEDNLFYGEIVKEELLQSNYPEVELYATGEDCINNLYKMPDIILLDHNLEGTMDGVEVLKRIKSFNPDIQVIMLSAQRELNIAINSLKYGALDYVVKNNRSFGQLKKLLAKINKWNDALIQKKRRQRNKLILVIGLGLSIIALVFIQVVAN